MNHILENIRLNKKVITSQIIGRKILNKTIPTMISKIVSIISLLFLYYKDTKNN